MNIWTERLESAHLPMLRRWLGREDGALTPNDLPSEAAALEAWFARCAAEAGRHDCLALVYETPVGIAGLRRGGGPEEAELYLFLGETGYNALRTATYVALRMLDRAFLELGLEGVTARVCARHEWFAEPLARMGFSLTEARDGMLDLRVEKAAFLSRKYLF